MSDLLSIDERTVWHPYTAMPITGPRSLITRAEGAYLFDSENNRYFDATSSWWCNIHGHCHPRLVAALAEQARTLDQMLFAPHAHPVAIQLADQLLKKLGSSFSKIFYSDNGSTAVESALKMAVQYWHLQGQPKRRRFLSIEGGYHGDTLGAVSVSHVNQFHHYFEGLIAQSFKSTIPYCYRCPLNLKYPSCEVACLDQAKRIVERHHNELAAVVIEPLILGAGGMISYPKEYLEQLVALCKEFGLLVIFDEVFTGFGRTGTFFALEQMRERPDMVCLSKGLTAGMLPLAVTAVNQRVFDAFCGGPERTFYHGHTFTANALGCAVALESLRLFDEDNVLKRNERLSALMSAQSSRFLDLPCVGEVRHLGMIWAVELVSDKNQKTIPNPANGPGWSVARALWKKGIWIRPLHNTVYLIPPYCTSESALQDFYSVLYSELQDGNHICAFKS